MAKDTDGLLLSASLDINKTANNIKKEDINKINAILANDDSARVKIVGGLNLSKTQSLIQSQIATISKNLKLNIGSIDTSGFNTQNITNGLKNVETQVQQTATALQNNEQKINSFRNSLLSVFANDTVANGAIDNIVSKVNELGLTITSLNQSVSNGKKGVISVNIDGIDKFGQSIKLTEQLNRTTGELIKNIDAISTASTNSASKIDDLMAQQIKRKAELTNQVNQIHSSAIDPNATRSITDSVKLEEINTLYNDINSAIEKMSGTTKTSFAESEAEVTKLITKLKSTVQEYRNAENVSTALKPDKLASAISKAESEFETLKIRINNTNVPSEKLKTSLDEIEAILNKPKNGEVINKAEIEQVFTTLSKVKSELNALISVKTSNSAIEKVKIQAETLSKELSKFASKNTGFNTFEQTINETVVSVTFLQNALKGVKSAADLSIIKAQISALKSAFNSSNNDIKKYTNLIDKATSKLNNLQNDSTFLKNSSNPQVVEAKKQIADLITGYQTLKNTLQGDLTPDGIQNAITRFDELDKQFKQVTTSASTLKTSISASDTMSKQAQQTELLSSKIKKLIAEINTYKNANSRMMSSNKLTSNGNTFAQELENMLLQLSHCASTEDFQKIAANFRGIKAEAKQLGIEGGTVFTTLWEKLKKFSSWMSMTSVVSTFVMDIRNAIVELKEVNTLLTEISKANDKLTSSQLAQIGNNSFGVASKYGKTATDYLAGVQEMSRAGYANAEAMGELSTAAQGAGDMTSDTANQFIIAADKAYKMNGSVEELTKTLDGINYITNNNAVNMSELSEGFSIVASTAASFDVTAQELAAALGTMSATTQQSGSEVARAFRAILLNIRQVSDEEENIDAEGLTKYEKACNDLGVSLKEVKDGVLQLRDPMEVLKELSVEYNKLDEADLKRTNLLNSIGGKLRATQLDAILRQWDMYEEMLQQYTDGSGSMANEANKTANSIEGLWNSLKNDWTSFVNEFANSDLFKSLIESARRLIDVLSDASSPLNSILTQFANLLELATKFTDKIGLIPTIFAGLSLKNVGELILKYARFRITTDIKCGECNTF